MSDAKESDNKVGNVTASMSKLWKESKAKKNGSVVTAGGVVAELFEQFPEEMANIADGGFDKKTEKAKKLSGMSSASSVVAELFEQFPEQMEQIAAGRVDEEFDQRTFNQFTIGRVHTPAIDGLPEAMRLQGSEKLQEKMRLAKEKLDAGTTSVGGVIAELVEQFPSEMEQIATTGDNAGMQKVLNALDGMDFKADAKDDTFDFDIYSSKITRLGRPALNTDVNTRLEQKVAAMKAARENELVQAGIPARELRVYESSGKVPPATSVISSSWAKADDALLKHASASIQSRAKRSQRFQTKAMREHEALKGAKVYTNTLIRVNFPDGLVVEANFSPLEKVIDVEAQIKECLRHATKNQFYLFVRPKNERLDQEASLKTLGLLPKATLQLVWEGEQPEGEYLNDSVLSQMDRSAKKSKRKSLFKLGRRL